MTRFLLKTQRELVTFSSALSTWPRHAPGGQGRFSASPAVKGALWDLQWPRRNSGASSVDRAPVQAWLAAVLCVSTPSYRSTQVYGYMGAGGLGE